MPAHHSFQGDSRHQALSLPEPQRFSASPQGAPFFSLTTAMNSTELHRWANALQANNANGLRNSGNTMHEINFNRQQAVRIERRARQLRDQAERAARQEQGAR